MMHPRWLALPLAVLTASATVTGCATAPAPRMLSADLHIGSLDERTSFELDHSSDDGRSASRDEGEERDDLDERVDTPRKQRVRRLLYITGLGALGFGIVGTVGFGIGGRIVQAQMKSGYEDGDLTRAREDQLSTAGTVMNALTITSAVIGLAGLITAATVYGVDHARCGELRPRRKQCPPARGEVTTGGGGTAGGTTGDAPSSDASGAANEADGASGTSGTSGPSGPSNAPTGATGGTGPAPAGSPGTGPAPTDPATAPTEGTPTAQPGPSPAGGKPSTGGKRAGTTPGQ